MLTKLMAIVHLSGAPLINSDRIGTVTEGHKYNSGDMPLIAPYGAPAVGPSINSNISLALIVNCDGITLAKNGKLSVDVLTYCAAGRVGWVKL